MSLKGDVAVCAACCVFGLLMASAWIQLWVEGGELCGWRVVIGFLKRDQRGVEGMCERIR